MKVFRKAALAAALCGAFVLTSATASQAAGDVHKGEAKLTLKYAYALRFNGTSLPEKDSACAGLVGGLQNNLVVTNYSVDTKTLIESATSVIRNGSLPPPGTTSYELHPLGIEGQYAFGSYQSGGIYAVLFSISTSFADPVSSVVTRGSEFNCLYSSQEKVLDSALKLRLDSAP